MAELACVRCLEAQVNTVRWYIGKARARARAHTHARTHKHIYTQSVQTVSLLTR